MVIVYNYEHSIGVLSDRGTLKRLLSLAKKYVGCEFLFSLNLLGD